MAGDIFEVFLDLVDGIGDRVHIEEQELFALGEDVICFPSGDARYGAFVEVEGFACESEADIL